VNAASSIILDDLKGGGNNGSLKTCWYQHQFNAKNTFGKMLTTNIKHQLDFVENHIYNMENWACFER